MKKISIICISFIIFSSFHIKANAYSEKVPELAEYYSNHKIQYVEPNGEPSLYINLINNSSVLFNINTLKQTLLPPKLNETEIDEEATMFFRFSSNPISIWNAKGELVKNISLKNLYSMFSYFPDSNYVISIDSATNSYLVNMDTNEEIPLPYYNFNNVQESSIYNNTIWYVEKNKIKSFHINTKKITTEITFKNQSILDLKISKKGHLLISVSPNRMFVGVPYPKLISYDLNNHLKATTIISDSTSVYSSPSLDRNENFLSVYDMKLKKFRILNMKTKQWIAEIPAVATQMLTNNPLEVEQQYSDEGQFSNDGTRFFTQEVLYDTSKLSKETGTTYSLPLGMALPFTAIRVGQQQPLSLKITYPNGTVKSVTKDIKWTIIKNKEAATIKNNNLIAKKTNTILLKASYKQNTKELSVKIR